MRRLVILLGLFSTLLPATVVTGKITDLTGQVMSTNRSVLFELQNCGNNIPHVAGASVIAPASKTLVPNAAAVLAGTIIGNDIVECGTTIGQTYYKVSIYAGTQKVYEKLYFIQGPTWNIATAIALSNDPTAFLNFQGYLLGDILYGAGTNVLGLVRGNTSTTRKCFSQSGDGTNSGQPFWGDCGTVKVAVPASAVSVCTPPAYAADTNWFYECVAVNTWRRSALSSW